MRKTLDLGETDLKTAVVTGSSRGIGLAVAAALGREGWRVVLSGRTESEALKEAAEALGAEYRAADLRSTEQVEVLFAFAGDVEALVCCAGVAHWGLLQDMTDGEWEDLFDVNAEGLFRCCRAAIPGMLRRKRGNIVTVSSVWGVAGASCEAAYSASKAAVIGLTKSMAKELGPSGVRVNCLAPGVIETDMLARFGAEEKAALAAETPLGRLGRPEDVAEAAAFLVSDRAAFITGQVIGIDGGFAL